MDIILILDRDGNNSLDIIDIEIPLSWPLYPFLPLKNVQSNEIGLLVDMSRVSKIVGFDDVVFLCKYIGVGPDRKYPSLQSLIDSARYINYLNKRVIKEGGWVPA